MSEEMTERATREPTPEELAYYNSQLAAQAEVSGALSLFPGSPEYGGGILRMLSLRAAAKHITFIHKLESEGVRFGLAEGRNGVGVVLTGPQATELDRHCDKLLIPLGDEDSRNILIKGTCQGCS